MPLLRSRLEVGLPPLVVTTNADDIETFERRLPSGFATRAGRAAASCSLPPWKGN